MTDTLDTAILRHKRSNERLFCATAFMIDTQRIVTDCGWLSPDTFHDERYRNFWAGLLAGNATLQTMTGTCQ